MHKKLYIAVAFAYLLLLKAYGQPSDKAYHLMLQGIYRDQVPRISPAQLHQALQKEETPKPVLLDTRSPEEYAVSHLPGARFIHYEKFELEQVQDLPKNASIVLYCAVGARSQRIGEKLKEAGYQQVYNLYGGIFEWVNRGFPVYNAKGKTEKVHAYSKAWSLWLNRGEKVYE